VAIVFMEPEKQTFIPHVATLAAPIVHGLADLALPFRLSLDSYAPEQVLSETLTNEAYRLMLAELNPKLSTQNFDMCFGPHAISPAALPYFLEYDGQYGDTWDVLIVPRLRIMANPNLKALSVPVRYRHPVEMKTQETGNLQFVLKRVHQLSILMTSSYQEVRALAQLPRRD
jgi:hypothetical protein